MSQSRKIDLFFHSFDLGCSPSGLIFTAPDSVSEDVVFWASTDRTVYAYAAFSGRQLWTKELIPPSFTLSELHISSPYLSGDRLYITCFAYDKSIARNQQKGWLYCLNMKQGDIIWKIPVTSGILTSPVGFLKENQLHIIILSRPVRAWFNALMFQIGSRNMYRVFRCPMKFSAHW